MIVRVKHVKRVRSKGRTYWYHQKTGERLPDDRDELIRRVAEINANFGPARTLGPGSVAAVAAAYKASPDFKGLAARTRHYYTGHLDLICRDWGRLPIAGIRRKHVLALRDKHAETPAKANLIVTVLRILLAFAIELEEITNNPARDIKKLKTGEGHQAWPAEAIDRFLEVASPMMALALKLGLYTGQREGDCLEMTWRDYDGEWIYVAQNKTGTKLQIPVYSELKDALEEVRRTSPVMSTYILTTGTGKPYSGSHFRRHFAKVLKAAGLTGLTFHGLRYTAAANLAEIGCSLKEIAAITGHRSLGMIEKYSRDADQRRLAGAVIHRLENFSGTKNGKRR